MYSKGENKEDFKERKKKKVEWSGLTASKVHALFLFITFMKQFKGGAFFDKESIYLFSALQFFFFNAICSCLSNKFLVSNGFY